MKKPCFVFEIFLTIMVAAVVPIFAQQAQQTQPAGFQKRNNLNPLTASKKKVYFCVLPFRNVLDQTQAEETAASRLITGEIFRGLNILSRWNTHWSINEPGHTVKDEEAVFTGLIRATFDSNLTHIHNISTGITKLMDDNGVDIIVTGLYYDDGQGGPITVRVLIYVKANQTIVMKNLRFKPGELVIIDPTSQEEKLHRAVEYEISHMFRDVPEFQVDETVKKVLAAIKKPPPPPPPPPPIAKLYVAKLSFSNAHTHAINEQTELTGLLNGPVTEIIERQLIEKGKEWNKEVVFNETGHEIPNTADNVNKVVDITLSSDLNLTGPNKIEKIINDIMVPHNIDVIVTGQYVDRGSNSVTFRIIVIFKSPQRIITNNFVFTINALMKDDPATNKKVLSTDAAEKISNKIKVLFESLN